MTVLFPSLTRWQGAYASEPPLRITARHPAVIEDAIEATKVGADLTDAIMRYVDDGLIELDEKVPIDHEHGRACWTKGIGSSGRDFPVHDSLIKWERFCRSKHRNWADHRGRPVCAEIAWAVIRDCTSLLWAAEFTGVTWDRAERLLDLGLRFMGRQQARWMEGDEQRDRRIRLRAVGV